MHHLPSRYIPCDGRLTASAYFDPRSPHGERRGWFRSNTAAVHFNPRSPQGSDNRPPYYALYYIIFQPTLPVGERPKKIHNRGDDSGFQSTLPTWGATDIGKRADTVRNISIHAPRMGSDSTVKAYSNDRIKRSTLREPHFFYSKNACFSPIVSMCATTSRTKKSENQSFIRIISRLGTYVFHLRLVSVPQIIEPYAVRLLVHQHFQCGTK